MPMGQLTETTLRPFLRFNPASFDHMDHVNETTSRSSQAQHGRDAGPGGELFSGAKGISSGATTD